MAVRSLSLQDHFLNSIRRAKLPVTIFLMKGVKLTGAVTWFDTYALLLRRDGASQLIYKHSISTIMPSGSLPDFDPSVFSADAAAGKPGLQDIFLAAATRQAERMTLFLVNGVMLQGSVTAFDPFCVLLERSGQVQLVYKHAISTLQPEHALQLGPEADGDDLENDAD